MAAPKEARESPMICPNISKISCSESKVSDCQAKRSKELLIIENNAVSKDTRFAQMFAKSTSGDKPASKIHRLPTNSVLSQVMSFLPQMKKANEEINAAIASGANYDIENVDEAEQVIEMSLGLSMLENESGSDSEDDSSASELENERFLHRPEFKKKIIEEIDLSAPLGNECSGCIQLS